MKHPPRDYQNSDFGEESDDYVYLDEDDAPSPQQGGRAVLRAAVAILAVVLVGVMLAVTVLPGGKKNTAGGDPDLILREEYSRQEDLLRDDPILAGTAEPTEEPTVPPEESPYNQYDFQYSKRNYLYCLRQESRVGVDVSAFQKDIDWRAVKASGVDFAMLRLGYRGWGQKGTLVEDEYIRQNLQGTAQAGIPIGAYFFSQATSLDEVNQEIEFMLNILGDYPLEYPIVLDWEEANPTEGRVRDVTRRELTDMLRYFCDELRSRGYRPMVYFNWTQAKKMIYLSELEDYPFWLALYQDRMTFPYRVEMWQYTCQGSVPGIPGDVDINIYLPTPTD